jgi:ubiquitin-conjugating enzyme (huntingtin interacting protein 2)
MTVRTVLLSLQNLLAAPEANDPQDAVVARQHIDNIELFKLTARYWTYIFALPNPSIDTKLRFKITPHLSKFPTASPNMPFAKFIEFNMKVRKLVEIMHTDELTALHELSSHNWDLDRATQSLIS